MSLRRILAVAALAAGTALVLSPGQVRAQATSYLRLGHPAYGDLDLLSDAGLVDGAPGLRRPYSRTAVARMVASITVDLPEVRARGDRYGEALERLQAEFAAELGPASGDVGPRVHVREVRLEGAVADSPPRAMRAGILGQLITADVSPLRFRNLDRAIPDGSSVAGETLVDLAPASWLTLRFDPRLQLMQERGGGVAADLQWVEGYARAVVDRYALEVGRGHHERGVLLSRNARGMDMIRVATEKAWTLPWVGDVEASITVADMGSERRFPHSVLTLLDLGIQPTRNVEMVFHILNHQGGEGGPEAVWWHRVLDTFLIIPQTGSISDKVVGGQLLVRVPSLRTRFWLHGSSTDIDERLQRLRGSLWDDAVWALGLERTGIGAEGRVDLRVEARRSGVTPHAHALYAEGLTQQRRVIGDDLGPMASSIGLELGWTGTRDRFTLEGAIEVYRGDEHAANRERTLISDNPDELRRRIEAEWRRGAGVPGLETGLRLGYELVDRFGFSDSDRSNYLARLWLIWTPSRGAGRDAP